MKDFDLIKTFTDAHNPAVQGSCAADPILLGLRAVANAAAAEEREACAKVAESVILVDYQLGSRLPVKINACLDTVRACAAAIRTRHTDSGAQRGEVG